MFVQYEPLSRLIPLTDTLAAVRLAGFRLIEAGLEPAPVAESATFIVSQLTI